MLLGDSRLGFPHNYQIDPGTYNESLDLISIIAFNNDVTHLRYTTPGCPIIKYQHGKLPHFIQLIIDHTKGSDGSML